MSEESLSHMLYLLGSGDSGWDAVLVQEGPKREALVISELDGGHFWYVAACCERRRSVAILLHARWAQRGKPRFKSVNGRLAQLCVQMCGVRVC